jgi:hypothetical protein
MGTYVLDRAVERPHPVPPGDRAPRTVDGRGRCPRAPHLSLEDALALVHLYAERESPKYEKAALRWLERYLAEGSPRLRHFSQVAVDLAGRHAGD